LNELTGTSEARIAEYVLARRDRGLLRGPSMMPGECAEQMTTM
jgi:hypothetical protein